MSILSGSEILKQVELGNIVINPFDKKLINPNSYNLRLGNKLIRYIRDDIIDSRDPHTADDNRTRRFYEVDIPESGFILEPGIGYLASTLEYTSTKGFVPVIDGRSSTGRLFLLIHCTAGYGDNGFRGHWTLEIVATSNPVRVYPGDPIAQIRYHTVEGTQDYYNGRYLDQDCPTLSKGVV